MRQALQLYSLAEEGNILFHVSSRSSLPNIMKDINPQSLSNNPEVRGNPLIQSYSDHMYSMLHNAPGRSEQS